MKKFLMEFKDFAMKGDVMSMAVGVIIGSAFSGLVTSFTDNIIQPIINCLGGAEVKGSVEILGTGNYINYGAFISAVINFIIMAFIMFIMIRGVNKMLDHGEKLLKKDEPEAAPTTKVCKYCQSEIPIKAVKCPHCTSDLT